MRYAYIQAHELRPGDHIKVLPGGIVADLPVYGIEHRTDVLSRIEGKVVKHNVTTVTLGTDHAAPFMLDLPAYTRIEVTR